MLTDLELWTYYKHIVNRVPLSNRFVIYVKQVIGWEYLSGIFILSCLLELVSTIIK